MKITEKETYWILRDEKNDAKSFASFLKSQHDRFRDQNVVIDLLQYGNLSLEELLSFLKLSDTHRAGKKSFVVVNDTINIDPIPDEIMVVPTLQEAADVVEMEEIERDLGF